MIDPKVVEAYKLLCVSSESSNDEVTSSFKKLAMKYHPDKNRGKVEWANNIMTKINSAYSIVMEDRFKRENGEKRTVHHSAGSEKKVNKRPEYKKPEEKKKRTEDEERAAKEFASEIIYEQLVKNFIEERENAKDALYRYFQYRLYNFPAREKPMNTAVFNDIVKTLQKGYHRIMEMSRLTKEIDLIKHFTVFSNMIFTFYKASECLNILDSYSNLIDVEAYRMYHRGDEFLHASHKEIFYDRHNRGRFLKEAAIQNALQARIMLKETILYYPDSSWVVESQIKLDYAVSLLFYLDLFFSEEED